MGLYLLSIVISRTQIRRRTTVETFEILVIVKHWIDCVYCCLERVKNEFIERRKSKNYNEKEDSGDIGFWDQQKDNYLEHLNNRVGVFDLYGELEGRHNVTLGAVVYTLNIILSGKKNSTK